MDPDIYQNLLKLKHETSESIALMEQTFTIYDRLPTGHSSYVDLLCPSKPPTPKQTLVTAYSYIHPEKTRWTSSSAMPTSSATPKSRKKHDFSDVASYR